MFTIPQKKKKLMFTMLYKMINRLDNINTKFG